MIDVAHEVGRFDETVLFRGENANVSRSVLCDAEMDGLIDIVLWIVGFEGGVQGAF